MKLHNIFLEEQLSQDKKVYFEKLKKEYGQLVSKNKNELENPSPYWSDSPDFKRIQELKKLLEPYTKQKEKEISNDQTWVKSMRKTVGDNSASYPEAEASKNTDMWLNMWAKDFILEFSKNELSKVVPSGSYGFCKPNHIHTYKFGDRSFDTANQGYYKKGKDSLYQELVNLEEAKLFICRPKDDIFNYKWDHKFSTDEGELGWFQLLQLDWGTTNKQTLYSKWNEIRNSIRKNEGQYCTFVEGIGEKCTDSVYHDPLEWLKDPHNLLTVLEIGTAFIPVIGPFLSAGFGFGNAALYWNEGKKEDAALSTFFAILPGLGTVGAKIAAKIGKEGLETLSQKIIKQGLRDEVLNGIRNPKWFAENVNKILKDVNPKEITLLKDVANSRKYLEKVTGDMAKTNPNKFKKLLKDTKSVKTYLEKSVTNSDELSKLKKLSSKVDTGINLGGVPVGLAAFPFYHKLFPGVREKIEDMGWDFKDIQSKFGTDGKNKEDNLKLLAALNSGWRPGKPIPEKYQTNTYKKFTQKGIEFDEETEKEYQNIMNTKL